MASEPHSYLAFVTGMNSFLKNWRAIVAGRGIPEVTSALSSLFGEDITQRVVKEQAEAVQKARRNRTLSLDAKSKSIVMGAGLTTIPVRPNTFFGD